MRIRLATCVALLALPVSGAGAASRFTIRGAGFGHGVGMSQYGAYGYALHGWTYDRILAHYYTGTDLGDAGSSTVRVLIQGSVSSAAVSGATSAGGSRLNPGRTYYVKHGSTSGTVALYNAAGKKLKQVSTMLTLRGSVLRLSGVGSYRGSFQFRPSGVFGVQTVNALRMEDYVRGVVSRESPASWPAEALKAQAVAARSYALTTSKGGFGFDQYADTRSQVYGGVAAETAATDAAVRATRGEVVEYNGEPVTTYFFSTSGGETENVENSLGGEPEPWLKGVKDPYDSESPKHRWGPYRWSMGYTASRLSGLVKGTFKGIDVVERGVSPRIVLADIVGSGGRTRVSGQTLRARFGMYDSWMYFTSITSGQAAPPAEQDRLGADPQARAERARLILTGSVFPAVKGAHITVQRRSGKGYKDVGETVTTAGGRYRYAASRAGLYRIRYVLDAGPVVRLR